MQVVVVTGHALSLLPQDAPALVPAPKTMSDDDLIPEGSAGLNSHEIGHGNIEICDIVGDVGLYERELVKIESELGARFDENYPSDIGLVPWLRFRVQQ